MTNIANWGMGTNVSHKCVFSSYGFPESLDPTKFNPDGEVCTKEEMSNHKAAVKDWIDKKKNNKKLNHKQARKFGKIGKCGKTGEVCNDETCDLYGPEC